MHTALLSALKCTPSGDLRAGLSIGGRSVLAWQAEAARALGCDRIVCLCDRPTREILDLQRDVEGSGGEFHAIKSSLQLVTLLHSDDVLLVIADGLMLDPDAVHALMTDGERLPPKILAFPVGSDLAEQFPEDFQRIDAQRDWAGILAVRAVQAQKLADLPGDGDAVSLILRLALQAGTATRDLSVQDAERAGLMLATDLQAASEYERSLVNRASGRLSLFGPANAFAATMARWFAPIGLKNGVTIGLAVALALALTGIAITWFWQGPVGLLFVAFASLSTALAQSYRRLSDALMGRHSSEKFFAIISIIVDTSAIISLILAMRTVDLIPFTIPIFAIALARVAGTNAPRAIAPFWNDRTVHLAAFAICAAYGVLGEGLAVFGLAALMQVMIFQSKRPPATIE